MNQGYIFSKESKKEYLYYIALLPLFIYGIYKNAYLLVENKYLQPVDGYKIILFPVVCGLIGLLLNLFIKKNKKELPIIGIIAGLCAPFNMSMYLYIAMILLLLLYITFIPNKYRINEVALLMVILLIINRFNHNVLIFNPMELTNMYHFTLLDLFFGRGPSFLFTSSVFWIIASYFVLKNVKTYKKSIFPVAVFVFSLLSFVYMLVTKEYMNTIKLYLNGTTFFGFVFLATINESSPSTNLETLIYSIFIAICSFIFVFILNAHSGAIIAILIASIIYRVYYLIRQKLFFQHR